MNKYINCEIITNSEISDGIFKLVLKGNFNGNPGQFYMIRAWDESPLLPRPLSICDLDEKSITFLYAVVGRGTSILSSLRIGEKLKILGPLGNGFELHPEAKCAIVAGGIGIAPMKFLSRKLKNVDLYVGYRNTHFMDDEILNKNQTFISTEDGSIGFKGYITDFVKDEYDFIYACGPNPMMNSLKKRNLKAIEFYSLEAHMACGIGACLGCIVNTTNGLKRVCKDGPVFEKNEVIFDA
ncbi:dihydroorotate dehydrogenase electron transfer subunit [uncultured Finegoldia sp.]|uniref:dihydroorotate dehydrogenase electron transfer subunit n=1 Tax=uncultured Finegoldia sp. TaxID=328009 RepID=UPI0026204441|nr:dihydroorotate dehydrogenase electron transfer subunit [uncultured Finegoldia sp.]